MFDRMRAALTALVAVGGKKQDAEDVRRLMGHAIRALGKPSEAIKNLANLTAIMEQHAAEAASWVEPDAIRDGRGGPFDAADLRYWLLLAERAGVPFIEAREILSLNEEEMSVLSGEIEVPDNAMRRGLQRRIENIPGIHEMQTEAPHAKEAIDLASLVDRLFASMDDIPIDWMVRSNLGGTEELKAWAGAGAIDDTAPTAKFNADLEVGPGWVREGNRRRVRTEDRRTIMLSARGKGGAIFLARPWMKAGRYSIGEDPHRHGTAFAGKGIWPCEWRVFVENGEVTGVSTYYAWTGEANAENAEAALQAVAMARQIIKEAKAIGAIPRNIDVELIRDGKIAQDEEGKKALARFPRDGISCTLDFMETDQGMMLLEGGPGCTPFGGGHPCGFAGVGGKPGFPNPMPCEGVAFKLMPGVILGDPKTWRETDRSGCILTWEETEALLTAAPTP